MPTRWALPKPASSIARSIASGIVSIVISEGSGGPPACPGRVGASTSCARSSSGSTSSQERHVSVKPCSRTIGAPAPPRCDGVNIGPTAGTLVAVTWRLAILAGLAVLAGGCGESAAPAADGPRATQVEGHYAETWGAGPRTVLLLPHGGWAADGPGGVRALRPTARRFVAMGWRTLTTSYAPGRRGLATVAAAWREASRSGPACVYGESSGGHWALELAARDRSVG